MPQQVVYFHVQVGLHQTVLLVSHVSLLLHVMKLNHFSAGHRLKMLVMLAQFLVIWVEVTNALMAKVALLILFVTKTGQMLYLRWR